MKGGWIWPTMNSCILCQLGCLLYLTVLSGLSWRLCSLAKRTIFSGLKPESLLLKVLTTGTYSWLFWPKESLLLLFLLTLLPPVCSWRVTWSQLTIWDFGIDLASLDLRAVAQATLMYKVSECAIYWFHSDFMASVTNEASALFSYSWWTPSYSEITPSY